MIPAGARVWIAMGHTDMRRGMQSLIAHLKLQNAKLRREQYGASAERTERLLAQFELGYDEGGDNWAVIATLIENCKISGINPHVWLTDTLTRLAAGHPANAVGELMPWTAVA